jgi:hypothetical protein
MRRAFSELRLAALSAALARSVPAISLSSESSHTYPVGIKQVLNLTGRKSALKSSRRHEVLA